MAVVIFHLLLLHLIIDELSGVSDVFVVVIFAFFARGRQGQKMNRLESQVLCIILVTFMSVSVLANALEQLGIHSLD